MILYLLLLAHPFSRLQSNDGPFGLNEAFGLQSPINTFSLSQVKRNPIWMDIVIENQPKNRILYHALRAYED